MYNKGELKEFPFLGVGISSYLASPGGTETLKLRQEVALNLELDNFSAITINGETSLSSFSFGNIELNINAVRNGQGNSFF